MDGLALVLMLIVDNKLDSAVIAPYATTLCFELLLELFVIIRIIEHKVLWSQIVHELVEELRTV